MGINSRAGPKDGAERQKALRDRRRKDGLVLVRYWLTPDQKARVDEFVAGLRET